MAELELWLKRTFGPALWNIVSIRINRIIHMTDERLTSVPMFICSDLCYATLMVVFKHMFMDGFKNEMTIPSVQEYDKYLFIPVIVYPSMPFDALNGLRRLRKTGKIFLFANASMRHPPWIHEFRIHQMTLDPKWISQAPSVIYNIAGRLT